MFSFALLYTYVQLLFVVVDGHVSHAISFFRLLYGWRRWNRWILCSSNAQQHATNTGKAPGPSSMTCLSSNYTSLVCIRWFVSAHICIVQQVCCIDRLQSLWARYRAQSQRGTMPVFAVGSPLIVIPYVAHRTLLPLPHMVPHSIRARAHTQSHTPLPTLRLLKCAPSFSLSPSRWFLWYFTRMMTSDFGAKARCVNVCTALHCISP